MERFYLIRHHTHQTLRRLLLSLSFQVGTTSCIYYKNNVGNDNYSTTSTTTITINNTVNYNMRNNRKSTCTLPRVSTIDRLILGQSTHSISTIRFDNASCDSIV